MPRSLLVFFFCFLFGSVPHAEERRGSDVNGFADATILLIRHAEKPKSGPGLAPEGEARAENYERSFNPFRLDGKAIHIDRLVATADSKSSQRPRLTLEPLSRATGEPIDHRFANRHFDDLVRSIQAERPGQTVLIAWHHGSMPKLLRALGATTHILPHDRWPDDVYGWIVVLRYDGEGHVMPNASRLLRETASVGETHP